MLYKSQFGQLKDILISTAKAKGFKFVNDNTLNDYTKSWLKTPSVTEEMIIEMIIDEEPQHLIRL
jgi:hypothetical protein